MKKNVLVAILALVVVVALYGGIRYFTSSRDTADEPQVTLSWGCTAPAEDLTSIGLQKVADLVEERSGGSLKINVFPASQLGTAMTQMEMVIKGNIDMFTEGASYIADWGVPDNSVAGFFFQCPNKEGYMRLLESDLYKTWIDQFQEETGLRTIAWNWMRPPVQIASNKPIYTLEDFKNLKIRSIPSEYTLAALKALGANPTSVAYDEVYLSMQQGVIDGTIATLDAVYTMNFYQVSKYLCKLDCGYINFAVWMNEAKFQSLSTEQQEILVTACNEVGEWYSEEVEKVLDGYLEKMAEHGVEIITYSPEERTRFATAAREAARKYEEDGTWSEGLFNKYLEIVNAE